MGPVTTYDVPTSLSPSRVESFTSCPLVFRFVNIEKIDDPPTVHTTRGSLVHRALELAFLRPAEERDTALFEAATEQAIAEYRDDPDFTPPRARARRGGHVRAAVPPASSPTTCGWRIRRRCRPSVSN